MSANAVVEAPTVVFWDCGATTLITSSLKGVSDFFVCSFVSETTSGFCVKKLTKSSVGCV
jgi:hypothetical protein